jgi:hypothetical protein
MENELVTIPEGEIPAVYTAEDFDLATKTGDYLPRLQLLTSASEVCKSGDFPVNHFAIIQGQNNKDLGESVNVLVLAWRPKALEMGEEVISIFDTKNTEFTRIQALSAEKDSRCMYGPEFLVWVPDSHEFATFFMGSKSMRREAPSLNNRMKKGATLKPHKITSSKYTWFSPKVEPCTTIFELPDEEETIEQVKKFLSPPTKVVERVSEEEKSSRAR